MRWVHEYSPEINRRIRKYLKPTTDSYRLDETYVKKKATGIIFIEHLIQTEIRIKLKLPKA